MSVVDRRILIAGSGELADALAAGLRRLGAIIVDDSRAPDAVVFAPWDRSLIVPRRFVELTDADFDLAWQQTMDAAVETCIAARSAFAGRRGNIVLTFPTTAFVGGAFHAQWAAAAEGVHILARSVARQWGPEGIVVNALALAPALVLAEPDAAGPVSIARPAVSAPDPCETLAFLCSAAAGDLAGQTLTVDGGLWM